MTIVFLLAAPRRCCPSLLYSGPRRRAGASPITVTVLVALLVCLIPTTIGGLLSAIGIAGMDRMIQANVIATSGRAVEAAGDVDVLLLDKTGTITLGNRQASQLHSRRAGVADRWRSPTPRSWRRSPTRRPRAAAIVVLAKELFGLRGRARARSLGATSSPSPRMTRMSGVDPRRRQDS